MKYIRSTTTSFVLLTTVSVSLRNKLQIDVGATWDPEMEMDHSQQTSNRETFREPWSRTEMDRPQQTNFFINLIKRARPRTGCF